MSYSIYLSGEQFDPGAWEQRVMAMIGEEGPWSLLPLMADLAEEGILEGSQLLVEGSIRGIAVEQQEESLLLNVHSFASRTDWRLLFDLVSAAVEMGAVIEEDADYLASGFDPARAEAAFADWWQFAARAMESHSEGAIQLPLTAGLVLFLKPGMLTLPPEELESLLMDRVSALGNAYACHPMEVEWKDGTQLTIAAWARISSLIPKSVQKVMFRDGEDAGGDYEIPIETLTALLSESDPEAGSAWLLPEVDDSTAEGAALLAKLISQAEATDLPPGADESPDPARLLADGPLFLLAALMSEDMTQMLKDIGSFVQAVPPAVESGKYGQLFNSAVAECCQDLQGSLQRVLGDLSPEEGVVPALSQISQFIGQLPAEYGPPYRSGLLHLGQTLVDASGGFFSAEKKRKATCLAAVKQILHS